MDFAKGTATFVIPYWGTDDNNCIAYIDEAVEGIFAQTDENWSIVIVDDCSPCREAVNHLEKIRKKEPSKINIIYKKTNDGPGPCRNIGISHAYENSSPIILFNDADDISDKKRLETVRKIFVEDSEANVVYSTFKIIDENSNIVSKENILPSIYEIMEMHQHDPIQGYNVWIDIGVKRGYTNLTSSTAVKTELAYKYPFPSYRVSEDQHTWLRYSADGGKFVYSPDIPSLYRIANNLKTASKTRMPDFYAQKAVADVDGFKEAIKIAIGKGSINKNDADDLMIRFHLKLAEIVVKENECDLAKQQIQEAKKISEDKTEQLIYEIGLTKLGWDKLY